MTLRVDGAARHFGRQRVFSALDLRVADGERLFLGGANGSGKTTLLRCLAGTLALTAGSATLDGAPMGTRGSRARAGVCLNAEQALYPHLSAHDNLVFAARLRLQAGQVSTAVAEVEDELGVADFAGTRVAACSSGMRARVSVARALLGRPLLLLLDEPTRSLDTDGAARLWAALDRRTVAVVIASHRDADRELCDSELTLARAG